MEHEQRKIRKAAGCISVLLGSVLAVYVGIWRMIIRPLAGLYLAVKAGELTVFYFITVLIKCGLSLTVGGFIWSVGYMIKCMLDA